MRRLPRMTTRRWMVAVAVASLLLIAFVTLRRAARYTRLAAAHAHMAQTLRSTRGPWVNPISDKVPPEASAQVRAGGGSAVGEGRRG